MKKFGLVMVVMFILCALGTHPVSAQEPEYGYVPLLAEGYDTSLPRQLVSRESFERLLPGLMAAKAEGIITDFEPDFYGGFVRVTNPSATLRGGSGAFPVKASKWDAIVRPPVSVGERTTRSATLQINLFLYDNCFNIKNASADQYIKGTLKTSSGELLGIFDGYADSEGQLWECFQGDAGVSPGSVILFKRYDSVSGWITSKTTVPRATFKTISKSTGVVTGTGTPGSNYLFYWWHPKLNANRDWDYFSIGKTIPSTGKWIVDFPTPFKGEDNIGVDIKKGEFSFNWNIDLPHLFCQLRTNYCVLYNLPNIPVSMTVKHAGILYSFSGKTNYRGGFYADLRNTEGDPVLVSPGDTITGTGATTYNLPTLTMSLNRSANTVAGKAPPNKWFEVSWNLSNYTLSDWMWTGSNSTGEYSASSPSDIPSSGFLQTDIYYTQPGTGNRTGYYKFFE